MRVAVIGAGLSGATVAHQLAKRGFDHVTVFDERSHVAGNCHTEVNAETNVLVHAYGPHIFHTNNLEVWDFVKQHGTFERYEQRTKAKAGGKVYDFPINLHTINQVYDTSFTPDEAREAISCFTSAFYTDNEAPPENFRDQCLATMGPVLYNLFFAGYTKKQWGRDPFDLPAYIARRIPFRFDYRSNVFDDTIQVMPKRGYTHLVENMLDSPRIDLRLGRKITKPHELTGFDFIFWSGPIDGFFDYCYGELPYRTLDFRHEISYERDLQGCAVMNHCDVSVPYTRTTEHKHFLPNRPTTGTVLSFESSREAKPGDTLFYPVHLPNVAGVTAQYRQLAAAEDGVAFIGRLGTYEYLNMDQAIAKALDRVRLFMSRGH